MRDSVAYRYYVIAQLSFLTTNSTKVARMFERPDWTLFRSLGTLGQKAGVPLRRLAALVIKELVDNALDAGATAHVERCGDWIYVTDDGPGLPGDADAIARLFSIQRPLTSSKLVRVPSRGALGNGLRVVVGAVLASSGALFVETRGQHHEIRPRDDGTSDITSTPAPGREIGTKIGLRLGEDIPVGDDVLAWSEIAIAFADHGKVYRGKTSPWWNDTESFFEMCKAAGTKPLADLCSVFRDVTPTMAASLVGRTQCQDVSRDQASHLLTMLRDRSSAPKPAVLGKIGELTQMSHAYAGGEILVGTGMRAQLPFSIEAFVETLSDEDDDGLVVLVNRTPITGEVSVIRQKSHQIGIIGCGLKHVFEVGRKPVRIVINVTTPYMPITTDGKEPDLRRYLTPLAAVIEKAAKKARRKDSVGTVARVSQKDVILTNMKASIQKASGDGQYRYSLRQLFYAVRPYMLEQLGKEPDYNYFAQIVTDLEAELGADLPGLYRDARGVIYHPHTGEEIPLGTINVENYSRPAWTFNKIVYSEKEGFFSILRDTGWPERNDCALLTSKGFASRAARDVIDLIGQTQEEIYFFCIHDADASGTMIYQALTEATRARGARKVHVINLGLDPWEALDMDLQVEKFRELGGKRDRQLPVAEYVPRRWKDWLQTQRVELNAMTSPEFIRWLDSKFAEHADKVVPPATVLREELDGRTRQELERLLAAEILEAGGFAERVNEAMAVARETAEKLHLESIVRSGLNKAPEQRWDAPLKDAAASVARNILLNNA